MNGVRHGAAKMALWPMVPESNGPTRPGTRSGCTKVSPGCAHCYAETFAERFRGVAGPPLRAGLRPAALAREARPAAPWKRPQMIFVNSMSDLFHEDVPDDVHRAGVRGDGRGERSTLPGAHEAPRAAR